MSGIFVTQSELFLECFNLGMKRKPLGFRKRLFLTFKQSYCCKGTYHFVSSSNVS